MIHHLFPSSLQTETLESHLPETQSLSVTLPPDEYTSATDPYMLACRIDRYLSNLFLQIGIPANKLGFRFLRESVKLVLQDPSLQHRLMHGLYPAVAEYYGTTVYCVEHSIRKAITSAWSRGRMELIERELGRGVITAYEKPTNGELIALVAENVRLLIREGKL